MGGYRDLMLCCIYEGDAGLCIIGEIQVKVDLEFSATPYVLNFQLLSTGSFGEIKPDLHPFVEKCLNSKCIVTNCD